MNLHNAEFIRSAASVADCPKDGLPAVAFAGKSNVGKSSVINRLLLRKNFARVGEAPGKTVHINYFRVDGKLYLVDLPGYGYAKVPEAMKLEWQKFIESYLLSRQTLRGLIVVMDIRHPLTSHDQTLLQWAYSRQLPVHILLNKADKLTRGAASNVMLQVRKEMNLIDNVTVQTFSAAQKQGLEQCWQLLERWLNRVDKNDNK